MCAYQLTNLGNMKYILEIKQNKIIYISSGKTDIRKEILIDEIKIFNYIISIGKSINELGEISQKENYEKWHYKSGGKTYYIDILENEFIGNALNIYNNLDNSEDNNYKQNIFNINRKIKKLISLTGIRYFNDFNNQLPILEENFFDFFKSCHVLYEINNILENINKNKIPNSKLWLFKHLNSSEMYDITKEIVNKIFTIQPLIKYDNKLNKPYYVFYNIFEIAYFHLLSCVILTQSKLSKSSRTGICEICGFIYIKTSNNTKYCPDCKTKAATKRKIEERKRKSTCDKK